MDSDHPWDHGEKVRGMNKMANLYHKVYTGSFHSGLNMGVATFQGFRLEGVTAVLGNLATTLSCMPSATKHMRNIVHTRYS